MTDRQARIGFADIKIELISRLQQLCRELLPDGKKSGGYWLASSPGQNNKTPNMWVRLDSGAWRDEPVAKGDVIDLVKYCHNLADKKATYDWCLGWLGWGAGVDRQALENRRVEAVKIQKAQDAQAAQKLIKQRENAFAAFLSATKDWRLTPLDTYLISAREIDLTMLGKLPGAIRFVAGEMHTDNNGKQTGPWPMMIALFTGIDGKPFAIHRTWLARDGMGKAPVTPVKKIWPAGYGGSVIRLSKGRPAYSPEEAVRRGLAGPVIIAEGIETGLSMACADPGVRVWAAGTLGNMLKIPDHKCVDGWLLAHDHLKKSLTKEQRQRHLKLLADIKRHFEATGKPVRELWPEQGNDFNDQIRI